MPMSESIFEPIHYNSDDSDDDFVSGEIIALRGFESNYSSNSSSLTLPVVRQPRVKRNKPESAETGTAVRRTSAWKEGISECRIRKI